MVEISTLSNGIRIIIDIMPHIETASLGVWVNVGSKNESKELNGASHFLEHMAFKGTHTRSAKQIANDIESLGGYLNAYTSRENTAYYVKMLKNDIEKGFEILSDILFNSAFSREEFEKERTVILQELYQTIDTPDDIVFDYFHEAAFGDTSFGRSILGTEKTIKSFTAPMIQGYMKENYDMEKMIISVSGNITPQEIKDFCEKYFQKEGNSQYSIQEKIHYQPRDFRKNKKLEQAHMLLGFEGFSSNNQDYYPSVILSTILGGGMSSRLFQEVREKRGLVYSIFASSSSFKETGIFSIYASSGEDTAGEVMPVICDTLLNSLEKIEEDELNKAKNQLKSSLMMAMESSSARAESRAMQMMHFNRILSLEELKSKIDSVDLESISVVLKNMLKSKPTFTALGPIENIESYEHISQRLVL